MSTVTGQNPLTDAFQDRAGLFASGCAPNAFRFFNHKDFSDNYNGGSDTVARVEITVIGSGPKREIPSADEYFAANSAVGEIERSVTPNAVNPLTLVLSARELDTRLLASSEPNSKIFRHKINTLFASSFDNLIMVGDGPAEDDLYGSFCHHHRDVKKILCNDVNREHIVSAIVGHRLPIGLFDASRIRAIWPVLQLNWRVARIFCMRPFLHRQWPREVRPSTGVVAILLAIARALYLGGGVVNVCGVTLSSRDTFANGQKYYSKHWGIVPHLSADKKILASLPFREKNWTDAYARLSTDDMEEVMSARLSERSVKSLVEFEGNDRCEKM